tara:strand:+ start:69 stop:494 length:426 start_codon:yes stop_codon:yes gene_type:complete
MEQELVKIEPEHVDKVWFLCAPMLEKAILRSEGCIDINDLYHLIMLKQYDLWVLFGESARIDMCAATKIKKNPKKIILEINFVGASDARVFKDFRKMLKQVENWAKNLGATETMFFARKGWKKLFPEFEEKYTVMTKKYEA